MTLAVRPFAVALAVALLFQACSSTPSSSGTDGSPSTPSPAASEAPLSTAVASAAAAAGEPCSFLTAPEVEAIVGTAPVEVAERIGRGDCDYWLTAAKDSKINVGVFSGAEALSYFESTKAIGTPEPVDLGDEAYSVAAEGIGTVVVARSGDTVVAVQVFASTVDEDHVRQATALVEAVLASM